MLFTGHTTQKPLQINWVNDLWEKEQAERHLHVATTFREAQVHERLLGQTIRQHRSQLKVFL